MKIKIGIIFGGNSKEREISFAGGRTVYDNLDKSIFDAVPLFIDSFGNFILLDWQYVYKGSIRDFYPPVEFLPETQGAEDYQIYSESLGNLNTARQTDLINKIGKKINHEELPSIIDFAFLCLHGPLGEDGKIQGVFEYLGLPYSGSGILASAIGIDKVAQKKLMVNAGFKSPDFLIVNRKEWFKGDEKSFFQLAKEKIKFPVVVKSATQGSSIGISILSEADENSFNEAVGKSFFTTEISGSKWIALSADQKKNFIRTLTDIREGLGIPVRIGEKIIYHPLDLEIFLNKNLSSENSAFIESLDGESQILIESFIEGREFSCIVIQNENNKPVALPPTEIKKGKELFDYRSKYLPGLSRKITPIDLPNQDIENIRKECERLFLELGFNVYARIDGFIKKDGSIFLNDPNTTSGMMPSSFFFHQAAEIGLNPSQFLTYIVRTSIEQRLIGAKVSPKLENILGTLDSAISQSQSASKQKIKIAVLLGGFSSERHISVESGRNIYEKLASSSKYEPIPVFLTGDQNQHLLYRIPVNILLKDNADDIKEKIDHYHVHEIIQKIIEQCSEITKKYSSVANISKPQQLTYEELSGLVDGVFIALHGRPGEDGAVQEKLDALGLPYNGSDSESSKITINKYQTNEILMQNGFSVAKHLVVTESEWNSKQEEILSTIKDYIQFPLIAKPVDDGCSSAVKKIKTEEELKAFAKLIFRKQVEFDKEAASILKIKDKEEFPQKVEFLIEELIQKQNAKHFLEVTGGMLTHFDTDGNIQYEVFEASESLAEGEVLSLEEKFLAGQGQNITPARYSTDKTERDRISQKVKSELEKAAKVLNIQGYARIDAFVRIFENKKVEVIFIEVNSLPGMTPATCIFHQTAINGYKPYDFIDKILDFGFKKKLKLSETA